MKIKAVFLLGLSFVVSLFVFGCSQVTDTTASSIAASYFPHEEGYTWRYEGNDGSGYIATFEGTAVVFDTIPVQLYRQSSYYLSGSGSVSEIYMQINDSGVYIYGSLSSPTTEADTFLQFPLEIGNSWTYYNADLYTGRITVAARETVTVPAGAFDCYKLSLVSSYGTIETDTANIWIGDGVGIVKTSTDYSTYESQLAWKNF